MTAEDDFLSRWSRRKREATEAGRVPRSPAEEAEPQGKAVPAERDAAAAEAFDITRLPAIDSINALSDVRDFLQAGVPADLVREALRKAWSADPAIRDFIGLSENAWDFTDPKAIPGFGPLEATAEVRQMIAHLVSRIGEQTSSLAGANGEDAASSATPQNSGAVDDRTGGGQPPLAPDLVANQSMPPERHADAAPRHFSSETKIGIADTAVVPRRTHGGALPK